MGAVVARLTYLIDISSNPNLRVRKLCPLNVGNTNRLSRFDRRPPQEFAWEPSASAADSAGLFTSLGTLSIKARPRRARARKLCRLALVGCPRRHPNSLQFQPARLGYRLPEVPKGLSLCRHPDRPRSRKQISQVSRSHYRRWAEMRRPRKRERARQVLRPPAELPREPRGDSLFPRPTHRACLLPQ